jgi:hypothetical protein
MTGLLAVIAAECKTVTGSEYEMAQRVVAAAFAPENREALREEMVERGAAEHIGWVSHNAGRYPNIVPWFFHPIDGGGPMPEWEPSYRFVPPDSSAGSGGAG